MPGGDRTGPMGMGPMTGRGAGYCAGYGAPGFASGGRGFGGGGRGFWGGRGRGRGWRNWFYATGVPGWQRASWGWPAFGGGAAPSVPPVAPQAMSRDQELDLLRRQAEGFAGALDEIRQRIEELEAQGAPR